MVKNDYMIMRGLTLANSGGQVGELSMQHAHPRILHPKISSRTINVLIWLVTLHMVSYSGVPWKNCVRTGAPHDCVCTQHSIFVKSLLLATPLFSNV